MSDTIAPSSVRLALNQKFETLPIFKRDRATALYHLCAALEMSTNPYTVDPDLVMAIGRRALEVSAEFTASGVIVDHNAEDVMISTGCFTHTAKRLSVPMRDRHDNDE